jgi:hypothetical protein
MMGVGGRPAMPLRRVCRQALDLERFSALQPSLRHSDPRRPARRVAGKLGHLLAVGGMSQEFLGRVHGLNPPGSSNGSGGRVRMSCRVTCAVSKLLGMFGKSQPAQRKLAPRHPVVRVGRSLRELKAFVGALLIGIRRIHDARSDEIPLTGSLRSVRFRTRVQPSSAGIVPEEL